MGKEEMREVVEMLEKMVEVQVREPANTVGVSFVGLERDLKGIFNEA